MIVLIRSNLDVAEFFYAIFRVLALRNLKIGFQSPILLIVLFGSFSTIGALRLLNFYYIAL